jgi:hypothetical protein
MAGVIPVLEDFIEQLEAEPIDDGPVLTLAEKRRRRLGGRPPPLPYNWVEKSAGVFVKLGYSATAVGKDWRQPDMQTKEASTERPEPPALFGVGEGATFNHKPTELLNPPKPSKEAQKAKAAATKAEKARYKALAEGEKKEEDAVKAREKLEAQRKMDRFAIAVKAARMVAAFGIGFTEVPAVVPEVSRVH